MECVEKMPMDMLCNTIKDREHPKIDQARALLEFKRDYRKVKASKEDMVIQNTYDFFYLDYALNRPP